jgi:hypothetical protein
MLPKTSVLKTAKLFTIHSSLVIKKICALRPERLEAVLDDRDDPSRRSPGLSAA